MISSFINILSKKVPTLTKTVSSHVSLTEVFIFQAHFKIVSLRPKYLKIS